MPRATYKLNRVGNQTDLPGFNRKICWAVVCCALSLTLLPTEVVFGQANFRPPILLRQFPGVTATRLAKKQQSDLSPIRNNVGEKSEYQFLPQSNFRAKVPESGGGLGQGVVSQNKINMSPLTGEVFDLTNNSAGRLRAPAMNPRIPANREGRTGSAQGRGFQDFSPTFIPSNNASQTGQANNRDSGDTDRYESLPPPLIETDENSQTPEGLEVITQRYPNGEPQIIRHVAQDDKGNYYNQGPWQVRNQSGRVIADGTYVRGLMDGQWRREHSKESSGLFQTRPFNLFQGPFLSVAEFKAGKLNGVWTIYDRQRTKIFEIAYENGVRHGNATWFHPNQAKMREATFKLGLIDGEILEYDDADRLTKRQQYVDGRRIVRNTTFYRPNVKKSEEYFLDSKLEPEDTDNWWEAKPTPYLSKGSETQNGPSMSWYDNGQPKKRGQFKDGRPVGQFTWWHANGNKQTEGFFVDGQKSRRWTWWYENGFKQFEGVFEDNKPVGNWRGWFDDGELRAEKNYQESAAGNSSSADDETTSDIDTTDPTDGQSVVESGAEPVTGKEVINQTATGKTTPPAEEQTATAPNPFEPESEQLPTPGGGETPIDDSTDAAPQTKMEEISPSGFRKPKVPGDSVPGESVPEQSDVLESIEPNAEGGQIEMTDPDEDKSDDDDDAVGSIPVDLFEFSESTWLRLPAAVTAQSQ